MNDESGAFQVEVDEAVDQLSLLLEEVETGAEVVIARDGRPVARLVRFDGRVRRLGIEAGRIEIGDDFDAPLPEELLAAFEGRSVFGEELMGAERPSGKEPSGPTAGDIKRPGT